MGVIQGVDVKKGFSLIPEPARFNSKNTQGQFQLDDTHTHPQGYSKQNRFGGLDFYRPDGTGVRYYMDGELRGFLEP